MELELIVEEKNVLCRLFLFCKFHNFYKLKFISHNMKPIILIDFANTICKLEINPTTIKKSIKKSKIILEKYNLTEKKFFEISNNVFLKYKKFLKSNKILSPEAFYKKYYFNKIDISKSDLKKIIENEEYFKSKITFNKNLFKTLKNLKNKYDLYIISNSWNREPKKILKINKYSKYFKKIYLSCEIGFQKPSFDFFNYVFKDLKIKANDCILIGDSYEFDIKGGKNMKIKKLIWITENKDKKINIIKIKKFNDIEKILL